MEMTRRVMTNVAAPEENRAPMGRKFLRKRSYPDASYRDVTARTPIRCGPPGSMSPRSADLQHSGRMKGRYALFPMLDGWTNVFQVPGKRTDRNRVEGAILSPAPAGPATAGRRYRVQVADGHRLILGRIYSSGTPADYKGVHALQDKISVVPLSSYGKPYAAAGNG